MAIPIRPTSAVVGAVVLLLIVSFTVGLTGFGGQDTPDQEVLVFDDVTQTPTHTAEPSTSTQTPTEITAESTETTTERETLTETVTTAEPTKTVTPTPTPAEPEYTEPSQSGNYQAYLVTGKPVQRFVEDSEHTETEAHDHSYIDTQRVIHLLYGNTDTGETQGTQMSGWQDTHIQECIDFQGAAVTDSTVTMRFYIHDGCDRMYYSLAVYEMPSGEYSGPENPRLVLVTAKARHFGPGHHYITVALPEN